MNHALHAQYNNRSLLIGFIGSVLAVNRHNAPNAKIGDVIVRIDKSYFRSSEVEKLLGNPTKAKVKLGWKPEITAKEMCSEMSRIDLNNAIQIRRLNITR